MVRAHGHAAAAAEWVERVAPAAASASNPPSRDVLLCRAMQLRCCTVEDMEDPAVLKRISLDYCAAMKAAYALLPGDPDVSHLYAESLMNIRFST